jgi:hypothetical protein
MYPSYMVTLAIASINVANTSRKLRNAVLKHVPTILCCKLWFFTWLLSSCPAVWWMIKIAQRAMDMLVRMFTLA